MGCETCSTSCRDQNAVAQITLAHLINCVFARKVGHGSTAVLGTAVGPEFQSFWKVAPQLVWMFFSLAPFSIPCPLPSSLPPLLPFLLFHRPLSFLRPDLPVESMLALTFQLACFHLLSAEMPYR